MSISIQFDTTIGYNYKLVIDYWLSGKYDQLLNYFQMSITNLLKRRWNFNRSGNSISSSIVVNYLINR